MDDAITNPLYGVDTGSVVYAEPFRFGATVLLSGMTQFAKGHAMSLSMTGNSDYLYTDTMNQGSLGMSGSYGVSGISKLSAAVSCYVGNTHSENSKSLAITLNCAKAAGIEYIDFDSLTVDRLMSGLKQNVMKDIKDALTKFNDMYKDTENDAKRQAWIDAVELFTERHGTGIVIGTLWGGWGAVELNFTKGATDDKWVYGGSADFEYAGTGASVAVSASYGGSKHNIGENAKASVTSNANGKCVEALVQKWFQQLQTLASKGLDDIGTAEVSPPVLQEELAAPTVPDFVSPEKDSSVAGLITNIDNLEGLKTYAQASAYDNYKKNGGKQSLKDWLTSADQKNDASKAIPTDPTKEDIGHVADDEDAIK